MEHAQIHGTMSGTDMFGFADPPPGRGPIMTKHKTVVKPSNTFPSSSASSSKSRPPIAGSSQRASQVSTGSDISHTYASQEKTNVVTARSTVQARLRGDFDEPTDKMKIGFERGSSTVKRTRNPVTDEMGSMIVTSQNIPGKGKGKKKPLNSTDIPLGRGENEEIKGTASSGPAPFPMRTNSTSSEMIIDDDIYASRRPRPKKKDDTSTLELNLKKRVEKVKQSNKGNLDSPDPLGLLDASADSTLSDDPYGTPTKRSKVSNTSIKGKTKKIPSSEVLGSSLAVNQPAARSPEKPPRPIATSTARPNRPIASSTARPAGSSQRYPVGFSDTDTSSSSYYSSDGEDTPRAKQRRAQEDLLSEDQRQTLRELRKTNQRQLEKRAEKARSVLNKENEERAARRQKELDDPNGGATFFRNLGKDITEDIEGAGGVMVEEWIGDVSVESISAEPLSQEYRKLLQNRRNDLEGYSEEESEYLRDYIDPDDRCEYCDGALPRIPSLHLCQLKSRLVRLSVTEPSSQSESGRTTLDWRRTIQYCTLHRAETTTVPLGLRKGYPGEIDFTALQDRIEEGWMRKELEEIMLDPDSSAWFNKAVKDITKMGKGKWTGMTNQNDKRVMDMSMPGYYGNFGREVLMRHYENLFEWNLLPRLTPTDTEISPITPLTPSELFRHVIAPEAGIRLIMADNGWRGEKASSSAEWSIARTEAYKIWKKSRDFGRWRYREESEEAREILETLRLKDTQTRQECERRRTEDPTLPKQSIIDVDVTEGEVGAVAVVSGDDDESKQTQVDPEATQVSKFSSTSQLCKRSSQGVIDGDEVDDDATPRGNRQTPITIDEETPLESKRGKKAKKPPSRVSSRKRITRTISANSNASTDYGDEIDWAAVPEEIANSIV